MNQKSERPAACCICQQEMWLLHEGEWLTQETGKCDKCYAPFCASCEEKLVGGSYEDYCPKCAEIHGGPWPHWKK